MTASTIFGYVVLGTASLVFMRWCWVSFTDWLDSYVADAVGDRREQPRQQVADDDWSICVWGDVVAFPPLARCPVDFVEVKAPAQIVSDGEGSQRGAGAFGTRGNQTQSQTNNSLTQTGDQFASQVGK